MVNRRITIFSLFQWLLMTNMPFVDIVLPRPRSVVWSLEKGIYLTTHAVRNMITQPAGRQGLVCKLSCCITSAAKAELCDRFTCHSVFVQDYCKSNQPISLKLAVVIGLSSDQLLKAYVTEVSSSSLNGPVYCSWIAHDMSLICVF